MPWLADNIQLVLFTPQVGAFPDARQSYVEMTGQEPDAFQRNPTPMMGSSTAQGSYNGRTVIASVQPGRLDAMIAGPVQSTGVPGEISDIETALSEAIQATSSLLAKTVVSRLSVVLNLIEPAATEAIAVENTRKAANLPSLPAGGNELAFSFNLRRDLAALPGCQMNRVMRWSALRQQIFNMGTSGGGGGSPIIVQEQFVSALTIDVNTAQPSGTIPAAVAAQVQANLAEEAVKLLHGGYGALVTT